MIAAIVGENSSTLLPEFELPWLRQGTIGDSSLVTFVLLQDGFSSEVVEEACLHRQTIVRFLRQGRKEEVLSMLLLNLL
jgi:hypothetical protein